jgi:hypothetical protein
MRIRQFQILLWLEIPFFLGLEYRLLLAISGASEANALVNPFKQWRCLDNLNEQGRL